VLNLARVKDLIDQLKTLDPETPIVFEYFTPDDFIDLEPTEDEFDGAVRLTRRYLWDGAYNGLQQAIEDERGEL
jgi:hypothetical protein